MMDLRDASIFAAVCKSEGFPEPFFEYRFHPIRRWRFDVAWPVSRMALEWEGIVWYGGRKSRHQTAKGYEGDCRKYNAAAVLGWTVLRYPQKMQNEALEDLRKIFK